MKALILVDLQNDFLPGGALAVPDGDAIVGVANVLQHELDLVVATKDWHPKGHLSFAASHAGKKPGDVIELDGLEQRLWPTHCVQGSQGAELAAELEQDRIAAVFEKGTDPRLDSYSGFFDNGHRKHTGLEDWLRRHAVDEVWIGGLATDYCVKWTALDAVALGFRTRVIEKACRGVELRPGDVEAALAELRRAGVEIV